MPEQNSGGEVFDQWAIVDVMGHQRYVGKVTEQVIAGCGFIRIDIPATDKAEAWTKLVGTGSIYAITPVAEQVARKAATRQAAPVQAWELQPKLQRALPGMTDGGRPLDDDDEFEPLKFEPLNDDDERPY